METPRPPQGLPPHASLEARLQALLALKREMLELHAHLEYLRLMLKLGVALR